MNLTFVDHQGKGARLAAALKAAGHDLSGGDTLLIDCDVPIEPYLSLCDSHARVIVYPHGGWIVGGDGQWPTHPHTVAQFVCGSGQADMLERCGYPRPVEVIGWPFSVMRAPRIVRDPQRVLLAPEHPMADGWLSPGAAESNARIHDRLAGVDIDLTVRYVDLGFGLAHQGIVRHPRVTYQPADMHIDDAAYAAQKTDVVVAAQGTFPSLALALGTPTVVYGQTRPDNHLPGVGTQPARSWDTYRDDVLYPLDADRDDVADLLGEACRWPVDVQRWRDRFVGRFDPSRFVELVEKYAS